MCQRRRRRICKDDKEEKKRKRKKKKEREEEKGEGRGKRGGDVGRSTVIVRRWYNRDMVVALRGGCAEGKTKKEQKMRE